MLKVTVEICLDGTEFRRDADALADSERVREGAPVDFRVELYADGEGENGSASLLDYPTYSTTVWDLKARAIAFALSGKEELPLRPRRLDVPVYVAGSTPYVRLREIPEPARCMFQKRIAYCSRPVIEVDQMPTDCAYSWDWFDFLARGR